MKFYHSTTESASEYYILRFTKRQCTTYSGFGKSISLNYLRNTPRLRCAQIGAPAGGDEIEGRGREWRTNSRPLPRPQMDRRRIERDPIHVCSLQRRGLGVNSGRGRRMGEEIGAATNQPVAASAAGRRRSLLTIRARSWQSTGQERTSRDPR